jgi:hypothetical protein
VVLYLGLLEPYGGSGATSFMLAKDGSGLCIEGGEGSIHRGEVDRGDSDLNLVAAWLFLPCQEGFIQQPLRHRPVVMWFVT